ncbi:MAG: hypothetical protein BWK75_03835 [Candidatus Altiarchaeales archaeon A3]|nr:MAG: hypothetical protein BWK75_03835 [Candidatus Altiarchaeales archaeon A3]
MNSKETFELICKALDFSNKYGLKNVDDDVDKIEYGQILNEAKDKFGIDEVYFVKTTSEASSIPVIYFRRLESVGPDTIMKIHRKVWNQGKVPLLFIILPGEVKIYNTTTPPAQTNEELEKEEYLIDSLKQLRNVQEIREKLKDFSRLEIETGHYWHKHRDNFKQKNRVDQHLLKNLKTIRNELHDKNLDYNHIHALIGRSIFILYLQDRQAIDENFFQKFGNYKNFLDILNSKDDTYNLFKKIEDHFNGDMFPVTDDEKNAVKEDHLSLLHVFFSGTDINTKQGRLWPYNFDVIPIELISCIYEEFFHYEKDIKKEKKKGTYYTPQFLVEFILDEILPVESDKIDIKILDPACGSGIFLVDAYKRIIYRWIKANRGNKIKVDQLRNILTSSIYGVDTNKEAIRVASFSLYLTMLDFLDLKNIWQDVKFPKLIGPNLFTENFFNEDLKFKFNKDKFDIIVGNPPWESSNDELMLDYCKSKGKSIGDNQIAQAFLWKALECCKKEGEIGLLVTAKGLLFNRSSKNRKFRKDFFMNANVSTIVNFSIIRRKLFNKGIGPPAAVFYKPLIEENAKNKFILYIVPKPSAESKHLNAVIIDPSDLKRLPLKQVIDNDIIWKVAMWGTPRDYELIKRLSKMSSFKKLCDEEKNWKHAEGFIAGKSGKKDYVPELYGKPYVDAKAEMPKFAMNEKLLPLLKDTPFYRHAKTNREIFQGPHLLVKESQKAGVGMIATLLKNDAVFSSSIIGIHSKENEINQLAACCLVINSKIAAYYEMLTSRNWLVERDTLQKEEIMNIPIPENILNQDISYNFLKELSEDPNADENVNNMVTKWYGIEESEMILVNDSIDIALDSFWKKEKSDAYKPVTEPILEEYAKIFCNAINLLLKKQSKSLQYLAYSGNLPLSIVSFELKNLSDSSKNKVNKTSEELQKVLTDLDKYLLEEHSLGIYMRRNVRIYIGNTIHVVKLNERRYWTKSVALNDADETIAENISKDLKNEY